MREHMQGIINPNVVSASDGNKKSDYEDKISICRKVLLRNDETSLFLKLKNKRSQ